MLLGMPCNLTTWWKNKSVTLEASCFLLHGIKCAILENLSTTTKIESLPIWVLGNHNTKSMLMPYQGAIGIGKGSYNPLLLPCIFSLLHVSQCPIIINMSQLSFGQYKLSWINFKVLAWPKWPASPPSYASLTIDILKEPCGMHNYFPYKEIPL